MAFKMLLQILLLAIAAGAVYYYRQRRAYVARNPKRLPEPPGPTPLPFIGNLRDISTTHQWLAFAQIGKTYGDIFTIKVPGANLICLNSLDAVRDLLDKRSANYSDRPRMPMLKELTGWGEWAHGMMDYGERWRQQRKRLHQHLHISVADNYQPMQYYEGLRMVRAILDTPNNFRHHLRHSVAAVVMSIVYGIQIRGENEKYITMAERVMSATEAVTPGRFLVDIFPILKYVPSWMPGAGFKAISKRWASETKNLIDVPFEVVRGAMKNQTGDVLPSLASAMLDDLKNSKNKEYDEKLARHVAASAYGAGSDTVASGLATLFIALAMYPEIQQKAHDEMDAVIGRNRLPTWEDRPDLPYLEAIIKEVLRWQPVTPLAVPHRMSADDEYNGYFLPGGSLCMPNTWAILHDERTFPDPHSFNPDRFLKDGKINPDIFDPTEVTFGYGRRRCPGRHIAYNSNFISYAFVVYAFNVTRAKDEQGKEIPVKPEMSPFFISHPKPFQVANKPRFEGVDELVKRALAERDQLFSTMKPLPFLED